MADMRALSKRHHSERPLSKLTDAELHLLDVLSQSANVFRPDISDMLYDLGLLIVMESGER